MEPKVSQARGFRANLKTPKRTVGIDVRYHINEASACQPNLNMTEFHNKLIENLAISTDSQVKSITIIELEPKSKSTDTASIDSAEESKASTDSTTKSSAVYSSDPFGKEELFRIDPSVDDEVFIDLAWRKVSEGAKFSGKHEGTIKKWGDAGIIVIDRSKSPIMVSTYSLLRAKADKFFDDPHRPPTDYT